jgi:hypothetical protein
MVNHWWQTTLYVSARGLTPSPIPYGSEVFQIDFDFLAHRPLITTSTGAEEAFALVPMGLADFYHQVMAPLRALGIGTARAAGQVRRVYNLMGLIGGGPDTQGLSGPAARWVDELSGYALEHGVDTFIFWPLHDPIPQLERFGQEIAPAVREAVARARATA